MKVKVIRLDEKAQLPRRPYSNDAGYDLVAIEIKYFGKEDMLQYRTGLAIAIPEGYVGLIMPRSSIYKTRNWMINSVGVIDSGYRGEILINFETRITSNRQHHLYKIGDRVAQLIIMKLPEIEFVEVNRFNGDTERGNNGFGSSGN